jgi:hypothetical protein
MIWQVALTTGSKYYSGMKDLVVGNFKAGSMTVLLIWDMSNSSPIACGSTFTKSDYSSTNPSARCLVANHPECQTREYDNEWAFIRID